MNEYRKIKLGNDIDLNNKSWTEIGFSAAAFKGTFDGQGCMMKEMYSAAAYNGENR